MNLSTIGCVFFDVLSFVTLARLAVSSDRPFRYFLLILLPPALALSQTLYLLTQHGHISSTAVLQLVSLLVSVGLFAASIYLYNLAELNKAQAIELAALVDSESKFRNAFDNAPLGMFRNTIQGQVIVVNQMLATMIGAPSVQYAIENIKEIARDFYVDPEERHRLVRAALDCDEFVTREMMQRRADGTTYHARSMMRAVRAADGTPLYLEGYLQDVSEQKEMLAALQVSEANYRSIFENAPIGIFQSTEAGQLISINDQLARFMQYESAEEALKSIHDLKKQIYVNPIDRDSFVSDTMISEDYVCREVRLYRKDNSIFTAEITMRAVRSEDGTFKYFEGFIEDISEARQAAESLQKRLEIDKLITEIVAKFASCDTNEIDSSIDSALSKVAQVLEAEHAYVVMVSPDGSTYSLINEWCREGVPSSKNRLQEIPLGSAPEIEKALLSDIVVNIPKVSYEPNSQSPLQGRAPKLGQRSKLSIPIHGRAGSIAGMIGHATYSKEVTWSESDITKLRIVGDAIAAVIERKHTELAAQRQSEFDEIISKTLVCFAACGPENIDKAVETALSDISKCFGGESSFVTLFSEDLLNYSCTHEWGDVGYGSAKSLFQNIPIGSFPQEENEILSDSVVFTDFTERFSIGTSSAISEYSSGIKSRLMVPVHGLAGTIVGMLGLNSHRRVIHWSDKEVNQIRILGDAIANVLERRRTEEEVRKLNSSLEQRIGQRTYDLEEARKAAIAMMQDVDEQRSRAEKALAELELTTEHLRLLSQAVDSSPAMVMITNNFLQIEYVNPKFSEVTGYDLVDAYGKRPTFLQPDEDVHAVNLDMTDALAQGLPWSGEILSRRKSGEIFWEYASFAPIKGPDGSVRHYVAVKEDISDRKALQDELLIARDEAERANRTKSLFLANMSHEIRTPMNAILGFSQLLQSSNELPGVYKQHLQIINRSGEHLLELINDILEMSKIEAGRVVVDNSVVDIVALADDLSMMFRLRCSNKNIGFNLKLGDHLPRYIRTDENKLRQILTNLLSNAVKLTETGRVVFRLDALNEPDGKFKLVAEVDDTGPGIAEEERHKVFTPFEQTASGIRTKSGTGLGLAISQQFAHMLHGEITFTSNVGYGSVFKATLLVCQVDDDYSVDDSPKKTVISLTADCRLRTVLIVDDEPENRILLTSMLNRVGFDTREAADGLISLDIYDEWKPDIVLMDAQMPNMDGYTATKLIRKRPNGRSVTIIGVSASAFAEDRKRMLDSGADDFISKPVRMDVVYSVISAISDVTYVYEEVDGSTPINNSPPTTADLRRRVASVPYEISAKIRQATIDADFDLVTTLVDEADGLDAALAKRLREMAEQYEATRIISLLSLDS